jgi:hypothetical protein
MVAVVVVVVTPPAVVVAEAADGAVLARTTDLHPASLAQLTAIETSGAVSRAAAGADWLVGCGGLKYN